MAEIEFRLPSKVPYGYVNVTGTEEEFGAPGLISSPDILARVYANYVLAFAEAERKALDGYGKTPSVPLGDVFKPVVGQEPDVHESAVQAPRTVNQVMSDEDVDTVAEAEEILKRELGATVIEEQGDPAPPWEKKAEAPEPKPWEKKATAKVANIEF